MCYIVLKYYIAFNHFELLEINYLQYLKITYKSRCNEHLSIQSLFLSQIVAIGEIPSNRVLLEVTNF